MESGYDKVFHGEISDPICKMEILEQSDRVGKQYASQWCFVYHFKKEALFTTKNFVF